METAATCSCPQRNRVYIFVLVAHDCWTCPWPDPEEVIFTPCSLAKVAVFVSASQVQHRPLPVEVGPLDDDRRFAKRKPWVEVIDDGDHPNRLVDVILISCPRPNNESSQVPRLKDIRILS